tara:strand:+ start:2102 stop:2932 length:831 start_codon:yes stop_codon:yes gene_type:complete
MKGSSMEQLKIKSFQDQSADRHQVFKLCSRFACDVLSIIDEVTGTPDEDGDEALNEEYIKFRNWLGPNVVSLAQSCVVGPLLSGLTVYEDGTASYTAGSYAERKFQVGGNVTRGRIRWICSEVPSLIEAYGELYEDEIPDALDLVEKGVAALSTSVEDEDLYDLADQLETLYLHCSPGARVIRGDEKAIAVAQEVALEAVHFINQEFERRKKQQILIDEGKAEGETSEEKIKAFRKSISLLDDQIMQSEASIEDMQRNRKMLVSKMEDLEEIRDGR